jgi:hemerythrin-like domain-containing protein
MNSQPKNQPVRERRALMEATLAAAGLILTRCATNPSKAEAPSEPTEGARGEAEVTPGEDLMQEHGVLERILLVYEEAARRIEQSEKFDVSLLMSAAGVVRRFVEEYHEKLEEEFVFPRLEAQRREVELVAVLRRQHQRGREITAEVTRLASTGSGTPALVEAMRAFSRMVRPHAAREDTVLFPAFRSVVGGSAYRELGESFEEYEHARFGEHGFENAVIEVARLEAALDIGDLAKFTP